MSRNIALDDETRAAARRAARDAGMSLSDWLTDVVSRHARGEFPPRRPASDGDELAATLQDLEDRLASSSRGRDRGAVTGTAEPETRLRGRLETLLARPSAPDTGSVSDPHPLRRVERRLEALSNRLNRTGQATFSRDDIDRDNSSAETLRADIAALAADRQPRTPEGLESIGDALRALGVSEPDSRASASGLPAGQDSKTAEPALTQEIAALRRAIESADTDQAVSRIAMGVDELARSVEASLDARQSVTEATAVSMAAELADIRGAIEDLTVAHGAGPDAAAVARLSTNLAEIRAAIEDISAGRSLADAEALVTLVDGIAELHERLATPATAEQLDAAADRLESRLDDLLSRIEQISPADGLEVIAGIDERIDALASSIDALGLRSIDATELEALKAEIDAIRGTISDVDPQRLDDLEGAMRDLAARVHVESVASPETTQINELEARLTAIADALEQAAPKADTLRSVEAQLTRLQESLSESRAASFDTARSVAETAAEAFTADLQVRLAKDLDGVRRAMAVVEARSTETAESLKGALASVVARLDRLEAESSEVEEIDAATGTFGQVPTVAPPQTPPPQTGESAPPSTSPAKADLAALRELVAGAAEGDDGAPPADRRAAFIAAARQAAQATTREPTLDAATTTTGVDPTTSPFARIGQAIRNRRKSLLLLAVAAVLAVGSFQMIARDRDGLRQAALAPPPAEVPALPALDPVVAPTNRQPVPAFPEVEDAALIPPPATARAAMALAAEEPLANRFNAAFSAGSVTSMTLADGGAVTPSLEALRASAAAGDALSAFALADRYAEGVGVARNFAVAALWYQQAAEAGLALAQYRLASLYERGRGVAKDPDAAIRWYRRAAEQGNIGAMHNLAVLVSEGAGGETNDAEALTWFRAAAEHGVKDSQYNLGVIYARGIGVSPDLAESYKWFAVAAEHGDTDAARRRDEIATILEPDELAQAKAAAETWRAKPSIPEANSVTKPSGPPHGPGITAAERHELIAKIQSLLADQGYDPGPPDGIDGPKTQEAVRAFQRGIGIAATGQIDSDLMTALVR
ncbi:peptidoglycan-binding protein [Bauldia sp.]|uniref:peptidoglycan-binding protein n=1 Tax=Bauldia sp. TaxID=2575872 RepID=UPI003BAD7A86